MDGPVRGCIKRVQKCMKNALLLCKIRCIGPWGRPIKPNCPNLLWICLNGRHWWTWERNSFYAKRTSFSHWRHCKKRKVHTFNMMPSNIFIFRFYYYLGNGLTKLGRTQEAHKVYEEAVKLGLFPSLYQRSLHNLDGLYDIKHLKAKLMAELFSLRKAQPWWSLESMECPRLLRWPVEIIGNFYRLCIGTSNDIGLWLKVVSANSRINKILCFRRSTEIVAQKVGDIWKWRKVLRSRKQYALLYQVEHLLIDQRHNM